MDVQDFIDRWRGREGGAERANYVLFLRELAEALDLPIPEPADSRSTYRFEFPCLVGILFEPGTSMVASVSYS